ncbi:MAG: hypothetical protein JWQ86_2026 [Mycobacterium sp.]|jgi:hypothetical protein|nr:hypothetical protein [Mycobacterium sp.]
MRSGSNRSGSGYRSARWWIKPIPGRQPVAGNLRRGLEHPTDVEHHRADPEHFLAYRVQIVVTRRIARGAGVRSLDGFDKLGPVSRQPFQCPGERGGGRVVPRHEQRKITAACTAADRGGPGGSSDLLTT